MSRPAAQGLSRPTAEGARLLTAAEMRAADRAAIERYGIPGIRLMERAGAAAWRVIDRCCAGVPGPLLVFAGKGNNGGDGLVVARLAIESGREVAAVLLGVPDALTGDAAEAYRRAIAAGVPVLTWTAGTEPPAAVSDRLQEASIVVDGVLGTGLAGPPRGVYAAAIRAVNAWRQQADGTGGGPRQVVALDVPSGLDADRGTPWEPTVRADLTVTFGALKLGLVMGPALRWTGTLWYGDIGIPDGAFPEPGAWLTLPRGVARDWPTVDTDSHKGRRGRLWIVAGSRGMTGAAILAARGALRAGAGLVHVAVPAAERPIVAQAVPEALTLPLPETESGTLDARAAEDLRRVLSGADAVVIGPGLGQGSGVVDCVRAVLAAATVPVVVDADALNAAAAAGIPLDAFLGAAVGPRVLTPHPGEAARLLGVSTGSVQADRPGSARALATRTGAVVVLKGARTLIAEPSGRLWVNPTGSPALATGGTGDVLAGAVGALCARGAPPLAAARAAVFLHGWAGQRLAVRYGPSGVVAGDVPAAFARAARDLTRQGPADEARLLAACGIYGLSRDDA